MVKFEPRNNCPLLGLQDCSQSWRTICTVGDARVVECARCGLGMSDPYPSEETVSELYADNAAADANFEPVGNTIIDRLKDYVGLRSLRKLRPGADRVLDYGTGNGRFALLSAKAFPNAVIHAVDYSPEPPPALRSSNVLYSQNTKLDGEYDLIMLRHVLEHDHHPRALLAKLGRHLTSDGILYIEVPNLSGWWCGRLSRRVNSNSLPFHIFHFTAASLSTVIESAGLHADIGFNDMPLMGTGAAMLLKREKTLAFQLLGVAAHPLQIILSFIFGPACVNAMCRKGTLSGATASSRNLANQNIPEDEPPRRNPVWKP